MAVRLDEDTFRFIKPEAFDSLGIDPTDIPLGTFAALKHPSQLQSRFGGNAYGFGLFEVAHRLKVEDIKLLQSISLDNAEDVREHYGELNRVYKKIGLLIRYSSLGKPYYLIPAHLASNTLTHVRAKVDEITKIVRFHRKKFFKEYHDIGLVTQQDDLMVRELSFRFKEHNFVILDSLKSIRELRPTLDLVILPRDPYEIILTERFGQLSREIPTRKRLKQYAIYLLWKLYGILKSDGEIFIISNRYTARTSQTTELAFKSPEEEKNFYLFTHIFKTAKKYRVKVRTFQVNLFDFQNYLGGLYVEEEVVRELLQGKDLASMTLREIDSLPYMDFELEQQPFLKDQEKDWAQALNIFYKRIFLKPLVPQWVLEAWQERFILPEYLPNYMLIYLGEKMTPRTTLSQVKDDVTDSKLMGCPLELLAEHRNSFEYVIGTLRILNRIKKGCYKDLPQIFIDRLAQPLENKNRRYSALNHVLKLMKKIGRLDKIKDTLNPDHIEGPRTELLQNMELLSFYGFSHEQLREILFIVLGHTPLGRIISGKMNEKALKPLSDLARSYEPQQALNLLRYCRLMTMAETEAASGSKLAHEQLTELFHLYESAVRIVTNRDLDWDIFLDETISTLGGIRNKTIRKLLKMTSHFEFLDNWAELAQKGRMEKESLAGYDNRRVAKIEDVIGLVNTVKEFEKMFLKLDPFQFPAFYRRFLAIEFHGTGHLFEQMDSGLAFVLLWITVNVSRGEVINFNPVLAGVEPAEIETRIKHIEHEVKAINVRYLGDPFVRQFGQQLYEAGSSFLVGTGFRLGVDPRTQALEIAHVDLSQSLLQLEDLSKELTGHLLPEIPLEQLRRLEGLFSQLETFYQSHLRLLNQAESTPKLPAKQKDWFQKTQQLRDHLRSNFRDIIFRPEDIYTALDLLHVHAPMLLRFILPEFSALDGSPPPWHLYLKSPVSHYILTAVRKLQALITHKREHFQDIRLSHTLAQREFGLMATGIVGVNESQMEHLESILQDLRRNGPLFDAFLKSFIFQDIGRLPSLRRIHKGKFNPADLSQAGALFIEEEDICERYSLDDKGKAYLSFLVSHHGLMHHIVRGEFSFSSLKTVLDSSDEELFDAFFVFSFIMLSAIREDLFVEDRAGRLFQIRDICRRIMTGETTFQALLERLFAERGSYYYALEDYHKNGIPTGTTPADYLATRKWKVPDTQSRVEAGRMIFALERLFRLRGIRFVEFGDLVSLMLKVPMDFVYNKRKFSSIGYATFEKEAFEALRIYNALRKLPEDIRHFIFSQLVEDTVRIFGYEKTANYLSYDNLIKLLLVGLRATKRLGSNGGPVSLNFLGISKNIEKRYEALNHYLNGLSLERLWGNSYPMKHFLKAKTGLILKKDDFPNVISFDFRDRMNVSQKIAYMDTINTVDQLKNYFHRSLRAMRRYPFFTDDYERSLEKAFEKRHSEITEMILVQAKEQMNLMEDFGELHNWVKGLFEQSLDIGLSEDQKARLSDLYEMRKDVLKRRKLSEIDANLATLHNVNALRNYWEDLKGYLQANRKFFGKEFEILIAKRFDEMRHRS